jgi:hypothetical protein
LQEYQYKNYTTEAAKAISKLIGKLPALKEYPHIAPVKIENLIRGWSGGLGMHVIRLASFGLEKAEVLPSVERPTKTYSDIPAIKAFNVRYPASGSESVNKFYDEYFRSKKYWNTFQHLTKKEFNAQEALKLIESHKVDMVKLDKIYDAMSNLHEALRLVYNNPNFNEDEKRQLIDKIYFDMSNIATFGNKKLKEFRKEVKK